MTLSITSTVTLNNGLQMPVFGLGTWRSEPGKVKEAVEYALKHGYRHIDAAHCYENQEEVGAGIKASGVPRGDVFVTTKLWNTHLRPDAARELFAQILSDLGLDYVDQLLIHWPCPFAKSAQLHPKGEDGALQLDAGADLGETWRAMEGFVADGRCRSIGVSNCSEEQVKMFAEAGKIKPATNQVEIQPYFNNAALAASCKSQGVHVVAYSPLGNYDPTKDLPSALKDPVITDLAKKYSKSPAQVIIRWHLQNGETVIPKSVTPSRIVENSQVFDFELTADEVAAIDALGARNFRTCNPRYAPGGALVWPNDTTVFDD
ncbi:Aldo/Keto reductase [Tribonema minus]|uniref:Aldo/Keto reductase n=1 Tax=Tribonema minus TaxID=303371 RepID=A0A836CCV3_9STRA|nr:Aldo/Keto reductase [Tribonema minus]